MFSSLWDLTNPVRRFGCDAWSWGDRLGYKARGGSDVGSRLPSGCSSPISELIWAVDYRGNDAVADERDPLTSVREVRTDEAHQTCPSQSFARGLRPVQQFEYASRWAAGSVLRSPRLGECRHRVPSGPGKYLSYQQKDRRA